MLRESRRVGAAACGGGDGPRHLPAPSQTVHVHAYPMNTYMHICASLSLIYNVCKYVYFGYMFRCIDSGLWVPGAGGIDVDDDVGTDGQVKGGAVYKLRRRLGEGSPGLVAY